MSAVGVDISAICAPIGRTRPATMLAAVEAAAVVIAVVAIEVAAVEEGEEVDPLHRKPVNSRETNRDSPACVRWGVPIEDHSYTDDEPKNGHGS